VKQTNWKSGVVAPNWRIVFLLLQFEADLQLVNDNWRPMSDRRGIRPPEAVPFPLGFVTVIRAKVISFQTHSTQDRG